MENVTCWAFRNLCRGATDSYTGMLSANYLIRRTKAWKEVDLFPIEGQKQWVQIATAKVNECQEFIARLDRENADNARQVYGIELNASCPSPQVINLGQGAALVKRTKRVIELLTELLKQDKYKIGIKLRLGLNFQDVREGRIFELLEELEKIKNPNFSHVIIHLKHAREPSSTPYNYEILQEITKYNLPLIINGGITNYKDFNNILKNLPAENRKNIKGLMIGREALKDPNCFAKLNNMFSGNFIQEKSPTELKKQFQEDIAIHEPKEIYLKTIQENCAWFKSE